jgi:hypothetical protein
MPNHWKPITGLEELSANAAPVAGQPGKMAKVQHGDLLGTRHCTVCGTFIPGDFYRVNARLACGTCATAARAGKPIAGGAAFQQGMLYGMTGAAAGLVFYAALAIVTNFYMGYIAAGVGWLVGWAMMKGSNGVGGRRFQIPAVVLTYASVSMASVPILLAQHGNAVDFSWTSEIGTLFLMGIFSPFFEVLNGFQGFVGLLVLFIGMHFAWRLTALRRLKVDGPHVVLG